MVRFVKFKKNFGVMQYCLFTKRKIHFGKFVKTGISNEIGREVGSRYIIKRYENKLFLEFKKLSINSFSLPVLFSAH